MSEVQIRPRNPDDDEAIVAIRRAINHDRPPLTIQELRHSIAVQSKDAQFDMQVAAWHGQVAGFVSWNWLIYVKESGACRATISVSPPLWGQGIGTALYDLTERTLRAWGARRLYGEIREDGEPARQFLTHRGFTPTGHGDRISRLDVQKARLDTCRAAGESIRAQGLRIATLSELNLDEDGLRAIHALDDATARDIPSTEDWASMPFEQWRDAFLKSPNTSLGTFWVAMDGERPVGLAVLERRSGPNADNGYTGVDRAYRGRGIARALKLQTVEWAQKDGIQYIYTGNDPANGPMLAINIDLGYQFLPANVEMVKEMA